MKKFSLIFLFLILVFSINAQQEKQDQSIIVEKILKADFNETKISRQPPFPLRFLFLDFWPEYALEIDGIRFKIDKKSQGSKNNPNHIQPYIDYYSPFEAYQNEYPRLGPKKNQDYPLFRDITELELMDIYKSSYRGRMSIDAICFSSVLCGSMALGLGLRSYHSDPAMRDSSLKTIAVGSVFMAAGILIQNIALPLLLHQNRKQYKELQLRIRRNKIVMEKKKLPQESPENTEETTSREPLINEN